MSPSLGRSFKTGEDVGSPARVAILSHELWMAEFGGDPDIIGRTINLDAKDHAVIGVMPKGFYSVNFIPGQPRLWVPLVLNRSNMERAARRYIVIGRLRSDASVKAATDELKTIASELATVFPDTNAGWSVTVVPYREQLIGSIRQPLLLLMFGASLILLIASFNAASLQIVRCAGRRKEVALCLALGASSRHVFAKILIEGTIISLLSTVIGLGLARIVVIRIVQLIPTSVGIPFLESVEVSLAVIVFTIVLCGITSLGFSVIPALQSRNPDVNSDLRQGAGQTAAGASTARLRSVLVILQLAIAVTVVLCECVILQTFYRQSRARSGLDPTDVLTFTASVRGPGYQLPYQKTRFFQAAVEQIRSSPNVIEASGVSALPPVTNFEVTQFATHGQPIARDQHTNAIVNVVLPRYFETMRIPILSGRGIGEVDTPDRAAVVVISRKFAELFFAGEDPLQQLIQFEDGVRRVVVGVTGDVITAEADRRGRPMAYFPYHQMPRPVMTLVVRHSGSEAPILLAARRILLGLDSSVPVYDIASMERVLYVSNWLGRFVATLLGIFATVSLILALAGVYALLAFIVSQRAQEFTIKVALGASAGNIIGEIGGYGARLAVGGCGFGVISFTLIRGVISHAMPGVVQPSISMLSFVLASILAMSLLACLAPAIRVARTDPAALIRQ